MCTWCAYMSFTKYSPLHEKKDTSQTLRKNTWRLHGITCRLTRSCKVHFAGKYPYLHVYNIHCHKKSTLRECNPKDVQHCTCYPSLFFTEWILLLTRCLLRNDARMWWWMCTLRVFVPFTQYTPLHEKNEAYIAEYALMNACTTELNKKTCLLYHIV